MKTMQRLLGQSRLYKSLVIAVSVYAVLRLIIQGAYLAMMLLPESTIWGGTPDWVEAEESAAIPTDLQTYLTAAENFSLRQDLYLKGSLQKLEDHYNYAPSFALAFTVFLWLSPIAVSIVHTLLHIGAYIWLFIRWTHIFARFKLHQAMEMLAWSLPVWLIFSSFWADLGYLNIYIIMALFATLLIEAILDEHFGWALFWASIIMQIKPQWIFAVVVPFLLGQQKFFFKLLLGIVITYGLVTGITILIGGTNYGIQQYHDYIQFLSRLSRDFPWRGPEKDFLGYNHSIKQIVVFLLGVSPNTLRLATGIKLLLLVPLGVVSLRHLLAHTPSGSNMAPQLRLDMAFAFYLGAFIWLDMVWELSLGIAMYPYLLGTVKQQRTKIWIHAAFLPYAVLDVIQVVSFIVLGMDVILPGPYIVTDPSIYFPLIMTGLLMLYGLLIIRLWRAVPSKSHAIP